MTKPKSDKSIHSGHRMRMKAEFQAAGLKGFSDVAKLEFILFFCLPQGDVNPISHALLNHFGTITRVVDAPIEQLTKIAGIGSHSANYLKMFPQFFEFYMEEKFNSDVIVLNSAKLLAEYFAPKFIAQTCEVAFVLCLDSALKPIACEMLSKGFSHIVDINVRKIMEVALANNAVAIVLSHNHPNGIALPSNSDLVTTKQIYNVLKLAGIKLIDHIIMFGNDFISITESGYLAEI